MNALFFSGSCQMERKLCVYLFPISGNGNFIYSCFLSVWTEFVYLFVSCRLQLHIIPLIITALDGLFEIKFIGPKLWNEWGIFSFCSCHWNWSFFSCYLSVRMEIVCLFTSCILKRRPYAFLFNVIGTVVVVFASYELELKLCAFLLPVNLL